MVFKDLFDVLFNWYLFDYLLCLFNVLLFMFGDGVFDVLGGLKLCNYFFGVWLLFGMCGILMLKELCYFVYMFIEVCVMGI